jgi:hypothetical protein
MDQTAAAQALRANAIGGKQQQQQCYALISRSSSW